MAYPELVSRGVSKSRKFKWLVKVGACKDVNPLILKKSWPGGVSGQPENPLGYATVAVTGGHGRGMGIGINRRNENATMDVRSYKAGQHKKRKNNGTTKVGALQRRFRKEDLSGMGM